MRARKHAQRSERFRPGECQRLVLEALRDAVEPLSGGTLAQTLVARKGLAGSVEMLAAVQKTALAVL